MNVSLTEKPLLIGMMPRGPPALIQGQDGPVARADPDELIPVRG